MFNYLDKEKFPDATIEERLHHVELYATVNVDSWIAEFAAKMAAVERRLKAVEAENAALRQKFQQ